MRRVACPVDSSGEARLLPPFCALVAATKHQQRQQLLYNVTSPSYSGDVYWKRCQPVPSTTSPFGTRW
ncbi:hypothetical protein ACRALDRAFT_1060541 [Sodiomyces alcalophilus JCM 7366]|uniref:uncharacterized protein n=1 Tax=Sodiomyces alcalophilus JCM 7366 TaxID=591952 RepID=UPI0039B68734